jgi:Raf kinase inhibitor-like YbhB/YbcL family protein
VGLTVARDGAVLFGDDTNNTLYRVSQGSAAVVPASPQRLALALFDVPRTISVTSPAVNRAGVIDKKYSDYGKGISTPLAWTGLPAQTRSVVVMMEDPDAVAPLPFVHWTVIDVPATVPQLPADIDKTYDPRRLRGLQGSNSKSEQGYFGPRPPFGDPPHHYHFQVFALDTELSLPAGFNRHALLVAMQDHVLASGELIGTFQAPAVP